MKNQIINFKSKNHNYPIIIGKNSLKVLPKRIKSICPGAKNIAFIVDKKVPFKFKADLKRMLKSYNLLLLHFTANEKNKSIKTVKYYLDKLLSHNFNRTDVVIGVGGGITGDVAGFVSSIYKRGINFINIPSTLLAQVDAAIGGKTGVNSNFGKNLIGSFYQPKLVINDISFLDTLPKKEMICGFAEILKHSIIKDKIFFEWLSKKAKLILARNKNELTYAIKKSCEIKIHFINQDLNESGLRMILNFGHTFAHAIEVKNNYSKNISHGEAVLSGMMLATRLSVIKKICAPKTLRQIEDIYFQNNLGYTYKKYSNQNLIKMLIPYLKNDKKNNDNKVNFILLKKIGRTTLPNKNKISIEKLKKLSKAISQY